MNWRPSVLPVAAIFFLSLLSACATGRGQATQDDLAATRQELATARAAIARLEAQLADLQEQSRQQAAALAALRTSVAQLRARLATSGSANASRLSKSKSRGEMDTKPGQAETPMNGSAAKQASPSEDEKNAYTAAYLALKSGRFDEASQGFAALLDKYPHGEYTDQALYWYGESLYAQHRLKQAAAVLERVVRKYRSSVKYTAALLRLGSVYKDLKRTGDAVAVFKRLIREYPQTTMAQDARLALQRIEQEKKK